MLDQVLVIDDDATITQVLSLLLKTHGFGVVTANKGEDGVRLIRETSPAVVVLDLMMPGIDGWEVCRQIRTFSKVPILILSAVADPKQLNRACEAGADDFLVKPVPSELLFTHIQNLLQKQNKEL